jgi:hypothetical protein
MHTPLRGLATSILALMAMACLDPGAEARGPTPGRPRFDGARALDLVHRQVDFGPRIPGSDGHAAQATWMGATLDSLADEIQTDTFTHVLSTGDTLPLVNLLARFRPEETRRILFLTHWDTRPRSDNAADPAVRPVPIPGANDGASGTAVLMELARLLSGAAPPMGVDLLFVDGEDYGPSNEDMFLGSRRHANRVGEGTRPIYAILLDMVGDTDASFPAEVYSAELAPIVLRKVLQTAERLGYESGFPPTGGQRIYDDHVPLNQAGIPTVDIIDFSYGPGNTWWHTPDDTPERLSAATLEMVGEVVAELIYSGG